MSMMNDDFSFLSSKNKKRSSLPNTLCVCVFFRVSKNGLYFFVCVIFSSSSISFFCCFVGVVGREYPPPPLSRHNNTRACFLSSGTLTSCDLETRRSRKSHF